MKRLVPTSLSIVAACLVISCLLGGCPSSPTNQGDIAAKPVHGYADP